MSTKPKKQITKKEARRLANLKQWQKEKRKLENKLERQWEKLRALDLSVGATTYRLNTLVQRINAHS